MRVMEFDGFRIDPCARRVLGPTGDTVALTGKAFDVLLYLVENRDRVVSKDDLLAAVWPGRVIEENTLTQAISLVRRALGSNASEHRHIVTLAGRGYRFTAAVQELDGDDAGVGSKTAAATAPAAGPGSARPGWRMPALLGVLAMVAIAGWIQRPSTVTAPTPAASPASVPVPRKTLAVLPFRAIGNGPRDDLLEAGMADTLITRLSRSSGLQVRALTSVQHPSLASLDAVAAARKLDVAYVVDGTTQRSGDQVRINARLLSVASGNPVWAQTFDARIDRVFTLQDRMSDAVTSALALAPVVLPVNAVSPCDGADALAYRAYLRGRYQINRPTAARMVQALADFGEAIDRDPTCARAWAGTAFAYRALVMTGDRDPRQYFPLAKAAVARALAIDPNSAEAYASKGFIEFWYDWDWPRSEASLRHAIALNPNLAEAHMALLHLLVNIGRAGEAAPFARQAVVLDPLSPLVNSLAGSFLMTAGKQEEGQQLLQKTLELEPDAWVALRIRSARAEARGDKVLAVADMRRAVEISKGHSNTLALLGVLYAKYGDRPAANRILAELEQRRAAGYLPASSLAKLTFALGDTPRTLDLLEQGYRERDVWMAFLLREWPPALQAQPRFQALLRRMHLEGRKPVPLLSRPPPAAPGSRRTATGPGLGKPRAMASGAIGQGESKPWRACQRARREGKQKMCGAGVDFGPAAG